MRTHIYFPIHNMSVIRELSGPLSAAGKTILCKKALLNEVIRPGKDVVCMEREYLTATSGEKIYYIN